MKIILASKSPRRKELLEMMGIKNFEIKVSDIDETLDKKNTLEEQIQKLAYKKAKAIFDKTKGDRIVIGSDTLVVRENRIYGKPKTKEEAFDMIQELQNAEHEVITGICIIKEESGKCTEYTDYDKSSVSIKEMTNVEIANWVNSGEAMDKAGAYAIQGKFAVYITRIEGNYYSVMGLPISKVYDQIKKYI